MAKRLSAEYQDLLLRALKLPLAERIAMIIELVASFSQEQENEEAALAFTDEELAELLHADPLPPVEIVPHGLPWCADDVDD